MVQVRVPNDDRYRPAERTLRLSLLRDVEEQQRVSEVAQRSVHAAAPLLPQHLLQQRGAGGRALRRDGLGLGLGTVGGQDGAQLLFQSASQLHCTGQVAAGSA